MAINYKINLPKDESNPVNYTNICLFMMRKDGFAYVRLIILFKISLSGKRVTVNRTSNHSKLKL